MNLFRNFFIFLSHQKLLETILTKNYFGKKISRKFVAGETRKELLDTINNLVNNGYKTTIAYLGEHFKEKEKAITDTKEYTELINDINQIENLYEISLKPSQIGLEISRDFAFQNLKTILEQATSKNISVNVDMEEYSTLKDTLWIVENLKKSGYKIGTVLQAYLKESDKLLDYMIDLKINVRLVKGAYVESGEIACQKKTEIDQQYMKLAEKMLENSDKIYPQFATHDKKITGFVISKANSMNIDKNKFEFQMLYGIRNQLQKELKETHSVRVYVPYGNSWYPYFMRRLAEKPSNAILILKSIIR